MAIYNIARWGEGFFGVNAKGQLVVAPELPEGGVALEEIVQKAKALGLALPVLVRFNHILHARISALHDAFVNAVSHHQYQGHYQPVYPIKVNQQRRVVEEMLRHPTVAIGLEAGSKPELLAVLALSKPVGGKPATIICNGYKDREYMQLALIGQRLGHRVRIVIEKPNELALVLQEAQQMNVVPELGVRLKLTSLGVGKWQNSGGEKSKFGLTASEVLAMVETLRAANCLQALTMIHFHLGSQIPNIRDIQKGMREGARYFTELYRLGVPISAIDVGGGLGVDYDGTASRNFCSINYDVREYATHIVEIFAEICTKESLPHPDIITESGRAMTAHHAVLLTEVIDSQSVSMPALAPVTEKDPMVLQRLANSLQLQSGLERYKEALDVWQEAQQQYLQGELSLVDWARAEKWYWRACLASQAALLPSYRGHRELLDDLNLKLADKYIANFSVFQSVPDVWGIDQIFPIVPLARLQEEPTARVILQDLTCDSDGCIDQYVDGEGVETTLPLPPLRKGEPYLLGIFLVGAYQEILGDMHNLFGDTDSVHVDIDKTGEFTLTQPLKGDTVADVLRYVHFSQEVLLQSYQEQLEQAKLSNTEKQRFLSILSAGLSGYTYLED